MEIRSIETIVTFHRLHKVAKAIGWIMAVPRGVAYLLGSIVGHLVGGLRSGFDDGR